MKRTRLATAGIAACLATALTFSACGARESSSASGGSDTSGSKAKDSVCTGKSSDSAKKPKKLTLALVPSGDAKKLVKSVKPLEHALTKRLGIKVHGVITQDYQAAVEAIGADKAQIGMLPSLQMSQACDKYGAKPALQTVRKDKTTYSAQFFTNKPDKYCKDKPSKGSNGMLYCNGTASGNGPAGLKSLSKLKGASVAMLQSASPAGYIFPAAAMKKEGINRKKDIKSKQVTANDASVLAVHKGDAQVGVSYWDAREVVQKDTPDIGKKVVVFALTNEIPNDGVSMSSKLSSEWQKKISDAMLDYAKTKDGKKSLEAIYQITGLDKANPKELKKTQETAKSVGLG